MRWKIEKKFEPYLGHERIIEKFLLLPVSIDGEYRWLEKVKILQRYEHVGGEILMKYRNKEWLD